MINFKKIYYEKYTKKSYSISNVDLILERIFSKIKNGVYIDIGCNHPIKYNNTYLLHKKGWKGINIDLDIESIKEFKKFRPQDTNICAVVSAKDGIKKNIYIYGIARNRDELEIVIDEASSILDVNKVIASILLVEDLRIQKD